MANERKKLKRRITYKLYLLTLFYFWAVIAQVQGQSTPQDCFTATTVCTTTYTQTNSYSGYGSVQELMYPGSTSCIQTGESNSSWYLFKIISPGTIVFQINPVNALDDYDFAIYNLTGKFCGDIPTGAAPEVSCNFSSTPGPTGLSAGATQTSAAANGPNQCAPLNVLAGETFAMVVNNFTATSTGYTLTFGGTATIDETDTPTMDSVQNIANCSPDRVTIVLSEDALCSSIAANGSDFYVTGPSAVSVISAQGISCATSTLTRKFRLVFSAPISVAGTYTIHSQVGNDGNTVNDFCGNQMNAGNQINFNVLYARPTATITGFTNAACNMNNGTATGAGVGGLPPYTYSWNSTPIQTTATATNLPPGTYRLRIYDANGCTNTVNVTIVEDGKQILTTTSTDATCDSVNNGTAQVIATGGTPPFNYLWSTTPAQTIANATMLVAGTYTVTVTGADGCTASISVNIQESGRPQIVMGSSDVGCGMQNTGTASVNATGTAPFTYLWSTTPAQITPTIINLAPGSYSVTVTDAVGCTNQGTVTVGIGGPSVIVTTTNATCANPLAGSATASISNAALPVSYYWSNGAPTGDSLVTGLPPGNYWVKITDNVGCSDSVGFTINGPPPLQVSTMSEAANCLQDDGMAYVTSVGGGVSPYTYLWNTTPGQTNDTAFNLMAGVYVVTVTDVNGCTGTTSAYISNIDGPEAFISQVKDATCGLANGSVTATVNTGQPPFSFVWDSNPMQNGATATGLNEGIYNVLITDVNGCISFLNVKVNSIPKVVLDLLSQTKASCGGADAVAVVSDSLGTPPRVVTWNTTPIQTGNIATGLAAGNYIVTVTDSTNCTDSITVIIEEERAINSITWDMVCIGNANAFTGITSYPGGVSWLWDFGDPASGANNNSTLQNPTHLYTIPGTYTVTAFTDGACATDTLVHTISNLISAPQAAFSYEPNVIYASVPVYFYYTGTTANNYWWDFGNGQFANTPNSLSTYPEADSVTVLLVITDSLGCVDSLIQTLFVDHAPVINIPNSFTPNDDGINDFFLIKGIAIKNILFRVFSRRGQMILETDNLSYITETGWDGVYKSNKIPTGVYVYTAEGSMINGKKFYYKGFITVFY